MEMIENVPLAQYSTMKLGGQAAYFIEAKDQLTLTEAAANAKTYNIPIKVIGGGSNIIWSDEGFPGLVILNRIEGFKVASQDDFGTYITIGAGERWDSVVERCVNMGLSGIECLSMIPGTAGATPIQNVGAYGQDISQTLVTVTAYDLEEAKIVTLPAADCKFAYRSSIFKTSAKDRYLITAITLLLSKNSPMPPFYPAVSHYLEEHLITDYTPSALRNAVCDIRRLKLPDPSVTPNCGSFFANPVVDLNKLSEFQERYKDIPHWHIDEKQEKLSAAWLIDQAGFSNYYDEETGIATWPNQSLIFTNRSAKTTADLIKFANKIKSKVAQDFGIELIQEPELIT